MLNYVWCPYEPWLTQTICECIFQAILFPFSEPPNIPANILDEILTPVLINSKKNEQGSLQSEENSATGKVQLNTGKGKR